MTNDISFFIKTHKADTTHLTMNITAVSSALFHAVHRSDLPNPVRFVDQSQINQLGQTFQMCVFCDVVDFRCNPNEKKPRRMIEYIDMKVRSNWYLDEMKAEADKFGLLEYATLPLTPTNVLPRGFKWIERENGIFRLINPVVDKGLCDIISISVSSRYRTGKCKGVFIDL